MKIRHLLQLSSLILALLSAGVHSADGLEIRIGHLHHLPPPHRRRR
jgi:hypothetical protein